MLKRLLDILLVCIALLLLWPIILVTALFVRLLLGGPVLFKQARPGRDSRVFNMMKFRSMTNDTDENGQLLADEVRLTSFGRFLRRSSLDELPGLFNVLRGDMSLVGPRPLLVEYLSLYNAQQLRRHEVRPGITGWAQVNGRNNLCWEDKFKLDVWYVDNRSLMLDIKILCMTVIKVIQRADVEQVGHVTMRKFTGTGNAEGERNDQ
ncbi:MAG: sugar transferase [Alteromonadaceae bacterium]|jgi:lipopolysaccharide/colanic/teichoic acid biosynthesis glycosyltransferase|uniref:sugar transferase n=1 Tax=Paraglaciecola chathamensis TaxID=368405 RepID=UPI000C5C1DD6|nr:sugar transferase [Paraglaciecola agarilytica]MBN27132.1 sugar transferase [Alteromonadaceae bacterium]|tara:strand:- start:9389 stop:10009 length:621 start_codon:yes stop_codon:yes gene_type:complete